MRTVYSTNGVRIRLTDERWDHIVSNNRLWLDYDAEVDVLYVHFRDKPASTHSEMGEAGIILDYQEDDLVGLTILDASQR